MTRPNRRRRTDLVFAAAVFVAIGCAPAAPGSPPPVHLFGDQSDVTLGAETRPAAAPAPQKLLRREFVSRAEVPEAVLLPTGAPAGARLLLHYRSSHRAGPHRRRNSDRVESHLVQVEKTPGGIRIPLPGLADYGGDPPVGLSVTTLPAGIARPRTFRAKVAIPRAGRLRVGYGIRAESWVPGAPPARFVVTARDGDQARNLFEAVVDPGDPARRRWLDAEIDLSEFAGREIFLDFSTRVAGREAGLTLPVWSDPVLYTPSDRASPNVILISLDTLRARSLGAYGYARDTSPFFDSMAAEGTLFENAITASVTTGPSHMSVFTGLYPVNHGVTHGLQRKPANVVTLAARFRNAGYATAAFAEDGYLVREYGFGEGFDAYTDNKGDTFKAPGKVRETFGQARRWLDAGPRKPFFLFVHTYQVHTPHDPPAKYADLFTDDDQPGPEPVQERRVRDQYDREIRYVDDELHGLFGAIRQNGLAESTIVVVLADHGEEFWEHGSYQHGGAVYEEAIHVPLVFWGPGRIPAGRRIPGQASLIDVAPTLLDLAGIGAAAKLDGESLAAAIRHGEKLPARTLFAEARAGRRWVSVLESEPWNPPYIAVRTDDRKFIVHRPSDGVAQPDQAFDLESDPMESSPLEIPPEEKRTVDAMVSDYLAGRVGENQAGGEAPTVEPEDPELTERLHQLGYVE